MKKQLERALYKPWAAWLTALAGRIYMRRNLHAIYLLDERESEFDSIDIYVTNHISRYDGFVIQMVHRLYRPGRRLFSIVLESEFSQRSLFRKAGAFRIDPGSVSSGRSLLGLIEGELKAGDSVSIFPQGEIYPQDASLDELPSGFVHFERAFGDVRFIPVALSLEPLNNVKSTLFIRVGQPLPIEVGSSQAATDTYESVTARLHSTVSELREFLIHHGERSPKNWTGVKV